MNEYIYVRIKDDIFDFDKNEYRHYDYIAKYKLVEIEKKIKNDTKTKIFIDDNGNESEIREEHNSTCTKLLFKIEMGPKFTDFSNVFTKFNNKRNIIKEFTWIRNKSSMCGLINEIRLTFNKDFKYNKNEIKKRINSNSDRIRIKKISYDKTTPIFGYESALWNSRLDFLNITTDDEAKLLAECL